jgi:threonine aldolase
LTRIADFRSDTVTQPTDAMREAMARAVVGDDVFGDDPTVHELETRAAALYGKEAAVFMPSGTMANQAAVRCHCQPGDEVLLHEGSHTFRFEQAGLAALHGVQAVILPGENGMVPVELMEAQVRPDDQHCPRTRLVILENTHNMAGGVPQPLEYTDSVVGFARRHGLALHMDGARSMNAAIALDTTPARLARDMDSVTLCLSKGLGAPVGTLLMGSEPFIRKARRARKLLGGGMRQVGVLAAAGLLALEEGPSHLAQDHRRARKLAEGLADMGTVEVIPPMTNIVVVALPGRDTTAVLADLEARGVSAVPFGAGRIRLTTHRDVGDADVALAVSALRDVLQAS